MKQQNVLERNQKKDYPEVVKNIHGDFNAASDTLESELKELLERSKIDLSKKQRRLAKLGFRKTKDAKVNVIKDDEVKMAEAILDKIAHYRLYYPQNKFILYSDVEEICEKYGLVLGKMEDFIGFVPEENLRHIENFKLREEDIMYYRITKIEWDEDSIVPITKEVYEKAVADGCRTDYMKAGSNEHVYRKGSDFEICAPVKDFDMTRKKVVKNQIVQDDPIPLVRVLGGFLIVTAWGDEASDPLVKNSAHN